MKVAQLTDATTLSPTGRAAPAVELDHENLVVRRGPRSGAQMAVAVHSTVLGPALGGLRLWRYDSPMAGVADVLRLAHGMTLKAAAAGLDLGGGKGVICAPGLTRSLSWAYRREMLIDFAELVESLDGAYITAEDVGTGTEDMVALAEHTSHVAGLPAEHGGSGDPSPFTAMGVEAAIRACVEETRGDRELRGLGVVVVGLGHVGARLAMRLAAAGARLTVTDIDPRKRALATRLDARWIESEAALGIRCDVLVPCALGGILDQRSAASLRTEVVCGAANNQLATDAVAADLAARGVLYAPDFIVNSGGLINCYRDVSGADEDWARDAVMGIETTMSRVFATARQRGITPLAAARELAIERLDAAVRN
jgi:leucine dehydrogenase